MFGPAKRPSLGFRDDRIKEAAEAHLAKLREATEHGAIMGVCQPFGPGHRGHR